MIVAAGSLELAQARVSARHGARADEALWRRIENVRELVPLLDLIRGTPLARWTRRVLPGSGAHDIEAALREAWREEVAVTAAWMPEPWQASVRWWGTWPDVAVIDHFGRGGNALPWMDADPLYRELAPSGAHATATRTTTGPARRLGELAGTHPIIDAWCSAWRRSLPDGAATRPPLQQLLRTLTAHRQAFASAGASGNALRHALRERLRVLFRAATLDPTLPFVHLALTVLELERLRAELVRRVIFPPALAA